MNYSDLLKEMCFGKKHMFIMAPGGYGKSYLIKKMQETPEGRNGVLYCATTGVAGFNINGFTLHSVFALEPAMQIRDSSIKLSEYRKKVIKAAHTLLIDEVSMLRIDVIERINYILQNIIKNKAPFGGLRIIFVGDLFQLGAIVGLSEKASFECEYPYAEGDYSFYNGPIFLRQDFLDNLNYYELQHDFRHEDDLGYGEMLSKIRVGICNDFTMAPFNTRVLRPPEKTYYLTVSNVNALSYNNKKLQGLDDKYPAISRHSIKLYTNIDCPAIKNSPMWEPIVIKNGMQIMFNKNDSSKRWFNGDSGILVKKSVDRDNNVVSVTVDVRGKRCEVYREEQDIFIPVYTDGKLEIKKIATISNLPFKVAWAISIYKSQSRTLPTVYIDLENIHYMKAHGVAYTALSRVQHFNDVYLQRPIFKEDIYVSPNVNRFYERIKLNIQNVDYDKDKDS